MIELKNRSQDVIKSLNKIKEENIENRLEKAEMSLFFEELIKRAKFYDNI